MGKMNLLLKQHKNNTTRKIMKLRKIKKRKIKTPKASIANCDHDVKRVEDKIKENELNSGNNSIQQIIQKENSLREEINLYRNGNDEPVTNISNNINNQNNNIRLDDTFSTQNELLLSPKAPSFILPTEQPHFNNFFRYYNTSSEFLTNDDLEREIIPSPPISPEQNDNRSELIIENQTNDRRSFPSINVNSPNRNELNPQNSIPLNNINSSNRNEFNPQNINANNNNQNIMDSGFEGSDLLTSFINFLLRRESREIRDRREEIRRDEIRSIKNKLIKIRFTRSVSSNVRNKCCTICCEEFKYYQNLYNLPCHHLFHVRCLNKEIKYRQKCPLCRNEF
jgi:hypothetical protein